MSMADPTETRHDTRTIRRRHLTILFSDLSDFTALSGAVEPERCLAVVDQMKESSRRVVGRHGGVVIDFRGDSVMAMFGFPQPSEYDGRRAVEAALELHEAMRTAAAEGAAAAPQLRLHSGVHSGLVLLIENDPAPGQFAVIGEVPNVAARLSDFARADEILVSATTLGGESHFFNVRERGDVQLQGKVRPVAVLQVLGHSDVSTRYEARTRLSVTPFVGRRAELKVLDQALRNVVAGAMRDVTIVGSAGVGKTRLVDEFLRQASGRARIHRGHCENYLAAEPLQPFLQIFRQLDECKGGDAPPLAPDAASVFDRFGAMAASQPLILFIDDWQWADDATKQVVARLRETSPPSLMLLIAARELQPDSARSDGAVLELPQFDREEAAEAIQNLRPDVDPITADQIRQLSGGNPLYIEELCHKTVHFGEGLKRDRSDDVPAWLGTLIESRVERLPPPHTELVRVAAVLGTVIPEWLLEPLTGHRPDDPIVRDLAEQDLIYPGEVAGTLRFKHGIARDVIYASVGLTERESLHRRIGNLLEQRAAEQGHESLLELLAYHFRAGADMDRAARYAELAGDKALAAAAPDRARHHYAASLTALDSMELSDPIYARWSRIVHRFGLACVFDPSRDQVSIFDRASALACERTDHAGQARAEYWAGFIRYALGEPKAALHRYEFARTCCVRAIDQATQAGDRERALEMEALSVQVLATMGQARAAAGEHDLALGLLDESLGVKRRHRRSGRPAVGSAYALACKGAVLGDLGRFVEAYECFDEALEAIRAGHTAVECTVVGWRSAVCLWHGRWVEAHECAARARSLAQRVGSLYVLAMGQSVAAYAAWMLDQRAESIDVIARATSWLEQRDKRLTISMSYGWMADIAAAMSDRSRARVNAARAIRRARAHDTFGESMGYRALADLPSLPGGRSPEAYLDLAMRAARRSPREQAVTRLHQARRAMRSGLRPDAARLLEYARSSFRAMDMQWHDAEAERCMTELGETHFQF
jgi:class 3 adenylate cyclase/tetratricopeptide (TPR) repeat protein